MRKFLSIRANSSRRDIKTGQALVEMALATPLLLFMAMGLLDLGRIFYTYVALTDATGEAALYLSVATGCAADAFQMVDGQKIAIADDGISGEACDPPNNAAWRARQAGGGLVDWSNVAIITAQGNDPGGVGEYVTVTIDYPFHLLTPIAPEFLGADTITLHAEAVQTIITE